MAHTQKNIKVVFLVCIDNGFSKKVVLYRGKMMSISSLKQFLKSMIAVKNDSSHIFCYLGHIPIGNKQHSKNLYHKIF